MGGTADPVRQDGQPAFVLHRYAFRETSLVVEAFTRGHGRMGLVARGVRRPKSALRGIVVPFQPLLVSWSGRTELRTLTRAEWRGTCIPLEGRALMCGFYLNELLLKLLPRDDPHETLFDIYEGALADLRAAGNHPAVLRRFEMRLLGELGYAVILDREVERGEPVARERSYVYLLERGPVGASGAPRDGVELSGRTLVDMRSGDFSNTTTLRQSKLLMRALINHHLGNQVLHTRQLLRDLQEL